MSYEPIGVGGVITTYALTFQEPLSRSQLEEALMERYDVDNKEAERAINLAFICGVLREEENLVYVEGRPD